MAAGAWACAQGSAYADTPSLTVASQRPLSFGTLLVPSSGSRTMRSDGTITDSGLIAIGGGGANPAQFAITYDRGNSSTRPLNIQVQVFLTGSQTANVGGVAGQISLFDTDLPGSVGPLSGSVATFTITDCRERRCTQTFQVGARLQVDRSFGGAELTFPLPVTATVQAVF